MTAQIQDKVLYQEQEYVVVGIHGEGLPSPQKFGKKPVMMSAACYRGYYLEYTCLDRQLALTAMTIRTEDGKYEPIGGVLPAFDKACDCAHYTGLNVPVNFGGSLLIGRDFVQEMYVHMGFQKPFAYRVVKELLFEEGHLLVETDYSDKIDQMRARMIKTQTGKVTQDLNDHRLKKWIDWMFSLDYDLA